MFYYFFIYYIKGVFIMMSLIPGSNCFANFFPLQGCSMPEKKKALILNGKLDLGEYSNFFKYNIYVG